MPSPPPCLTRYLLQCASLLQFYNSTISQKRRHSLWLDWTSQCTAIWMSHSWNPDARSEWLEDVMRVLKPHSRMSFNVRPFWPLTNFCAEQEYVAWVAFEPHPFGVGLLNWVQSYSGQKLPRQFFIWAKNMIYWSRFCTDDIFYSITISNRERVIYVSFVKGFDWQPALDDPKCTARTIISQLSAHSMWG